MRAPSLRRAGRWFLVLMLVVVVILVLLAVRLVWPHTDNPGRADAVFVLSGDHGERLSKAKELLGAGVARTLVLDGEPDSLEAKGLCEGHAAPFQVVCLTPRPDSTRAEAQAAGSLVGQQGWRRIVVVTTTYHVTRARLLFGRCVKGAIAMVGASPPYGRGEVLRQLRHEWLGLVYARLLTLGC